ncbi:TonB dependent receptor [endosymbiont of Ridgeia piscesae]|uniref:TonB dependent receptor n=1 Tax=endosymbiont of Ridgeia piscesae TaxID=54398 RepID=A0A0T5Z7G2_9GAMM|nr:TonB dependent receptor [endosymbiont of Ridgeia piscesae]
MGRSGPLRSNNPLALVLLLFLLAGRMQLCAAGSLFDDDSPLQIHGFLTQGYVKTSDNSFFGDSEDGSTEFREIGVNFSYRISPKLMASGQLLSRRAGGMYDGSPAVDYAQFDYSPYISETGRAGIIVGRYKNVLGFYNDTRDVASTRPSIFLPQVIYWDRVRNTVLSNDGIQLYGELHQGDHSLYLNFGSGKSLIDENMESTYLINDFNPDLSQQGLNLIGRLLYEWQGGRLRIALSGVKLDLNGTMSGLPSPLPPTLSGSLGIDYWLASAQYNEGPWSLTLEYMQEPLEYSGFGSILDSNNTTVDGYYLQGSYRLAADWELLLRYEEGHFDKDDPDGSGRSAISGRPAHTSFSKLTTLGLLWEPTEQLILRAEYGRANGTMFLSSVENPDLFSMTQHWNMFSLLVSYGF